MHLMNHNSLRAAALALTLAAGCAGPKTPDSHPEVFVNGQTAAIKRRAEQLEASKDLTIDLLAFERPDLKTTKGEAATVIIQADGQSKSLDLAPLQNALLVEGAKKQDILHAFLRKQIPAFDQDRLRALGFEHVKPLLVPSLLTRTEVSDLAQPLGPSAGLHTVSVIGDLSWMPMVSLSQGNALLPLSTPVITAWKVEWPAIEKAALDNIRPQLTDSNLLTTSFAPIGSAGGIQPSANPAIILLPEFLPLVRKAWHTDDNLVLLAASARDLRFIEQHNDKLLAVLYPGWQGSLRSSRDPLSTIPILLDDKGFSVFEYSPAASKPATKPSVAPATKPSYIVH